MGIKDLPSAHHHNNKIMVERLNQVCLEKEEIAKQLSIEKQTEQFIKVEYYKFQFICNTPSFLEWTKGFLALPNGPKGFQKLFSLLFFIAFVGLSLCFCSKRSSFAF
jgi:hypothetical protein